MRHVLSRTFFIFSEYQDQEILLKYTNNEYSLDQDEYDKIRNRLEVFQKESKTKKAIHITLISGNGYKQNKYSGILQQVITGEDFFI